MNFKVLLFTSVLAYGLNACKEEEPTKAMTTINGRFVEYGTDNGIEGLRLSLVKYKGFGLQFEQLTDVIYTDSNGHFTINYELNREGVYYIFSEDETYTYAGFEQYPFDFILGKPVNLIIEKYTPAWINVRVINQTRPVYSYYTVDVWGDHAFINESDDTTVRLKISGNYNFHLTLKVYDLKSKIIIEKSFLKKVQNWMERDTTIVF